VLRRIGIVSSALVVTGLVIAGCSGSKVQGAPSGPTGGSSSTGASAAQDLHGAPPVANPLDTTKFQQNPCASLTAVQLQHLRDSIDAGTEPKSRTNSTGPACGWGASDRGSATLLDSAFLTAGSGLSSAYAQKSDYAVFDKLPDIQGYPAVVAMSVDGRSQGHCSIQVGVTDQLVVSVQISVSSVPGANGQVNPYYKQPCTPAQQVAEAVMTTLRGGA
jgi:hypothetical protein